MTKLPRQFCSECKRPVLDGQAHHGLTGEHYKCYEKRIRQGRRLKKLLKDKDWEPEPDVLQGNTTTGWLAPDGKFYACPAYAHIHMGDALAEFFYSEEEYPSSVLLERKGWGHISNSGVSIYRTTQAQLDTLFDWFVTLQPGTRLYTCLKWLLKRSET